MSWMRCYCSVAQSCTTLCDPTDCSMPDFSVLHHLLEIAQTHVHWVSDAIQPSHPLSSPSPAFYLSHHQGLFQWLSSSHQVAKELDILLTKTEDLGGEIKTCVHWRSAHSSEHSETVTNICNEVLFLLVSRTEMFPWQASFHVPAHGQHLSTHINTQGSLILLKLNPYI